MKLSIIRTAIFLTVAGGMVSCKKTAANIDPDNLTGAVIDLEYIQDGQTTINSGLQYFGAGALSYPATDAADTLTFQVNVAGPNALSQDLTVTAAQDLNAINDNYKTDSIKYLAMPDSVYHFISKTATIKAGSRVALFKAIFFPSKIDPTKNYMLAVTATNTQGIVTSGNYGHIYLHTIGNPLAGIYTVTGTRYNYSGSIAWPGPPAAIPSGYTGTTDLAGVSPEQASPDNTKTIEIGFSNLGSSGYNYVITGNADFSVITVGYNSTFTSGDSNVSTFIVSYSPPSAGKPSFHIITHYNNTADGSGNDRIIDQTFVHQ